jgi:hypothetical protein
MGFVVEDGTGTNPLANSYVSLAEANAYHTDRNNAAWTGTDAVKEAALVRATDYLDQTYAGRWKGEPLTDTQALAWPREVEGIPEKLKQACCLLALETIGGASLNPTQGQTVKREKVDVIEVEYMTGQEGGRTGTRRPAIDQLLYGLITGGSALNAKVVRV